MTSTDSGTPALALRGISKRFGDVAAVDAVDLDIPEGEFFTIVGPSGSGKSTLLRVLAGLEEASAGTLHLRGEDITRLPANQRPTALVFQSLALFDHRSVGQNIEFAMKMKGIPPAERQARARELLALVRLSDDYYDRAVTQCSGGERQRIAMARALASDPEILFFDEPLSALDYRLRKTLEVELKELHQRTGKTFIYITHSLEEAMVMSDRIAIMQDGRFVQVGTPQEIYRQPRNRFVAGFMGEVNIFTVQGEAGAARLTELNQPVKNPGGSFGVLRPEALRAGRDGEICFDAEIQQRLMLGSRTQYHLSVGDLTLIAELGANGQRLLEPGEQAGFSFDSTSLAWVAE